MATTPNLETEARIGGTVCGVDEVGRGCLAGPVTAAAVIVPPEAVHLLVGVRDSKAMSRLRREACSEVILAHCLVGIGEASVEEIGRLNILGATFLAMSRAVALLPARPDHAIVDGNKVPKGLGVRATAMVGGDARSVSVAAASIVAKVSRDAVMRGLDALHPGYGWGENAGYGTSAHMAALDRLGPTTHHRPTFGGVREKLWSQAAFAFA